MATNHFPSLPLSPTTRETSQTRHITTAGCRIIFVVARATLVDKGKAPKSAPLDKFAPSIRRFTGTAALDMLRKPWYTQSNTRFEPGSALGNKNALSGNIGLASAKRMPRIVASTGGDTKMDKTLLTFVHTRSLFLGSRRPDLIDSNVTPSSISAWGANCGTNCTDLPVSAWSPCTGSRSALSPSSSDSSDAVSLSPSSSRARGASSFGLGAWNIADPIVHCRSGDKTRYTGRYSRGLSFRIPLAIKDGVSAWRSTSGIPVELPKATDPAAALAKVCGTLSSLDTR
mmetsp:Transcript_28961/g.81224  ORF Transcript_28961/g.81224 Transcript_28961/m.81224 type:complete len:286 (+) Transcript_28961:606-1463(+)